MGTKSPSDLSQSSMGDRQLRSHGPVRDESPCLVCKRPVGICICSATPSSNPTTQRNKPKKKTQQPDRTSEPSTSTRRQLFKEDTTDNVEERVELSRTRFSSSQPGPSGLAGPSRFTEETVKVSGRTRHTCPHCPKSFGSPGKLNQHMYAHTGERPFVCDHCRKAFSSKFKLVRHALIHSDQRQYVCLVCERTFHRKDHLKNHAKIHSPIKRRYKCDREGCGKEYSSLLSYRKHVAVHAAEDGNLECTICGKKFTNKEEIVLHLKIHAGSRTVKTPADRKYHCDHCDRSFYTGKDVRRHLVVHTGKRDFLCQFCPQRFGRKDHLVRHIKKSHNNSGKKGRKKTELKTKSVETIVEEAAASRLREIGDVVKSESRSSFGLFEEEDKEQPSTSGGKITIFKTDTEEMSVHFSQTDEILSESGGSLMSDIVYQTPPPPYPSVLPSTMTYDPGTSSEIKSETMTEFINLIPSQLPVLPPNCLLTMAERPEEELPQLLPGSHFITADEDALNIHRHILSLIGPQSNQDTSTETEMMMANFLSPSDTPSNTTPLPRFNQAFHQPP